MTLDDIHTIAVIGAGDMGHGIAEVALLAGYPVRLYDINEEAVHHGVDRIFNSLDRMVKKGKVPVELAEQIKSQRLFSTTDLEEAVSKVDIVVEVVPEVLELKKQIFRKLDSLAPRHALLLSNTSTMSITEMGNMTGRPGQVLGTHFFNPPVIMKLVEVIRGDDTADEVVQLVTRWVEKLNKVPVPVKKDTPGFIVNRINAAPAVLFQVIVERCELEPEPLDAFMRTTGLPIGPCELTDYVGIDVMVNVGAYFAEKLHPNYGAPSHLIKMVETGKLGKKSGQGYYDWSNGRPRIDLSKATKEFNPQFPIFVQINEACKLIEEGICSVDDVDRAIVLGSGARVGPMQIGRTVAKLEMVNQLNFLASHYNMEIFKPTRTVLEGGYKH